jgi:hypothetical protein
MSHSHAHEFEMNKNAVVKGQVGIEGGYASHQALELSMCGHCGPAVDGCRCSW